MAGSSVASWQYDTEGAGIANQRHAFKEVRQRGLIAFRFDQALRLKGLSGLAGKEDRHEYRTRHADLRCNVGFEICFVNKHGVL